MQCHAANAIGGHHALGELLAHINPRKAAERSAHRADRLLSLPQRFGVYHVDKGRKSVECPLRHDDSERPSLADK